MAEKILRDSRG